MNANETEYMFLGIDIANGETIGVFGARLFNMINILLNLAIRKGNLLNTAIVSNIIRIAIQAD